MRKQHLFLPFFLFLLGFYQKTELPKLSTPNYYTYIESSIAQGNMDLAIRQYDTLRLLAIQENDSLYHAFSYSCVGEIHFMYKNMKASKNAYLASSKITQNFIDKDLYIKDCVRLLGTYKTLGIQDSAFYYMNIADQLIRNEGVDKLKKRQFFNQKALFYQLLGKSDSSIYYFIKATEQVDTLNNIPLIALYGNIGATFASRMNFEKALEYYDKILTMPSIESYPRGLTATLLKKAQALKHSGRWEEAKSAILHTIELEKSQQVQVHLATAYCTLAEIHLKKGLPDLAEATLDKIEDPKTSMKAGALPNYYLPKIKIALHNKDLSSIPEYLDELRASIDGSTKYYSHQIAYIQLKAQYLQAIGDTQGANIALNNYIVLSDSFYTLSQSNIIHDLETAYQTEIKENKIALLNTEKDLATTKLTAYRKQLLGMGLGIVLLGFLLFRVFHLNSKLETAIEQKDFLLKEIHHRVKNNLQFISSLLSLQSEYLDDPNAVTALQEGQNRVQSMSLIHQKLYQEENLSGIEMKDYFENLTENLFDSYNINPDKITLNMDIQNVHLDVDTAIPLGLIVNELISNALKYAFPKGQQGTIQVSLVEKRGRLCLSVTDNGVGMPTNLQTELGSSFGYKLIHAFKTQLEADLAIVSDNGTKVEIQIKDYKKIVA